MRVVFGAPPRRWSLVDALVDTFTAAMVQLQPLMSVPPAAGLLFFAAVVVLTMLAAESFDPREIWDARFPPRSVVPEISTFAAVTWLVAFACVTWRLVGLQMSQAAGRSR
jgi:hypothetical protein